MTYPTRFCTQLRTLIDEFLAGLDDVEVRQRAFQSVPAKLTPSRSAAGSGYNPGRSR